MARPKADEVRDILVSFRLTVEEYGAISERAADTGYDKVPAFCRAASLATTPLPNRLLRRGPSDYERLMHEELKRIGVNLNQIARHLNTYPHKELPPDLGPVLSQVREFLDRELTYGP